MKMLERSAAVLVLVLMPFVCLSQTTDRVADGKHAYMAAGCYQCHGTVAQGGVGPRLAPKPFPIEALTAFVRTASRNMPAYDRQMLSDDDLKLIHAYLSSIEASPAVDQIPQLR